MTDPILTFATFERRVAAVPDLELSPWYWNHFLYDVTGRAIWLLWVWPALREVTQAIPRRGLP